MHAAAAAHHEHTMVNIIELSANRTPPYIALRTHALSRQLARAASMSPMSESLHFFYMFSLSSSQGVYAKNATQHTGGQMIQEFSLSSPKGVRSCENLHTTAHNTRSTALLTSAQRK